MGGTHQNIMLIHDIGTYEILTNQQHPSKDHNGKETSAYTTEGRSWSMFYKDFESSPKVGRESG